ncbi:MAG: hypothetical protein Q9197_004799 [Variospora fuerteventurae]
MLEKVADEADANAHLARQKYERRKRHDEEGRLFYRHGDRKKPPRADEPRYETYATAPDYPSYDSQGVYPPGFTNNPAEYLPGPSNQFRSPPAEEELYRNNTGFLAPQARQKDPIRGRTSPAGRQKRRRDTSDGSLSSGQRSEGGRRPQ